MIENIFYGFMVLGVYQGYSLLFPKNPLAMTTDSRSVTIPGTTPKNVVHFTLVNSPSQAVYPRITQISYETPASYPQIKFNEVSFKDLITQISSYLWNNKYTLSALSLSGIYMYMMYTVHGIKTYLYNKEAWSAWKNDMPFEQLLAIPQDTFAQELLATIQIRYENHQNPTDFLTPLINFSHISTQEQHLVTQYHRYITWILRSPLQRILPVSDAMLTQLTERKHRIAYIKTVFNTWLTHYKLEQIRPSRTQNNDHKSADLIVSPH